MLDHPPHCRGFEEIFEPRLVDMGKQALCFCAPRISCQEDDLRQPVRLAAFQLAVESRPYNRRDMSFDISRFMSHDTLFKSPEKEEHGQEEILSAGCP